MEAIIISKCEEVVDNWGNTSQYVNEDLYNLLTNSSSWSDDQIFYTNKGFYDIEDLIGEKVQVGEKVFVVTEE